MNHSLPTARLTVDLDAIAANWRLISQKAKAAAVVKADAYGLGAVPVARALVRAGCTRFFVATLGEAVALRQALADPEILVLNGVEAATAAIMEQNRLIPVLNTKKQIEVWGRRPAALHFDTGMSRLGLDAADPVDIAPMLVMSHLACPDTPEHPLNRLQLERFTRIRERFPKAEASLAASSGVFLGPDYRFDWLRPGAALYGVNPTPGRPNPMHPVVRLEAKILQLRQIDEGATVGYGATHLTSGRTCLATVAAGYADGLFRTLGNRGLAFFGDCRLPLVGRVSMDLTVFDASGVQDIAEGAMVELIGPHHSVDDLAAEAGTIGYEILTGLGPRIERHYLGTA
jgi:alanine racemase